MIKQIFSQPQPQQKNSDASLPLIFVESFFLFERVLFNDEPNSLIPKVMQNFFLI